MLNHKNILITGGTGSFGKRFINIILNKFSKINKIIIFSRDELKQYDLKIKYPQDKYPQLRFYIGDVRDSERLNRACEGVDYIIHAAALKQVDTAELNPDECIKTNISGATNVINSALNNNVSKVIALSTDKACAPINLYGATKLVSDKLFTAANNIKGEKACSFSVVRYGNVMGSRGSVIPFFIKNRLNNVLTVTDPKMTRFNISLDKAVDMVLFSLKSSLGGEIFVPKIPSYRILDVAKAISPKSKIKIVGIRPGEKLHEEMITQTDSLNTVDIGDQYIILPSINDRISKKDYIKFHKGKEVEVGFEYNSGTNSEWETVESLRDQIVKHVDPLFKI
jgi:UDP-N-acetylglucosamine 4,6-dehydratase (inverting)